MARYNYRCYIAALIVLHAISASCITFSFADSDFPRLFKRQASSQGKGKLSNIAPREHIFSFDLEKSYKDEIEALDREYSIPTLYRADPPASLESEDAHDEGPSDDSKDSFSKSRSDNHQKSKSNEPRKTAGSHIFTKKAIAPKKVYKYERKTVYDDSKNSPSDSQENRANCEKYVDKDNRNMNCVVCADPKTGGKSKSCSYKSSVQEKPYIMKKSLSYAKPHNDDENRYKRYSPRKTEVDLYEKFGAESQSQKVEMDPYERLKAESQKRYSETIGYSPSDDYEKAYQFPKFNYGGEKLDQGESEVKVDKLVKDGASCQEVHKDGMVCTVCKNEKSGGNYEKCSYASTPVEKKYAFAKSTSSDFGDGNNNNNNHKNNDNHNNNYNNHNNHNNNNHNNNNHNGNNHNNNNHNSNNHNNNNHNSNNHNNNNHNSNNHNNNNHNNNNHNNNNNHQKTESNNSGGNNNNNNSNEKKSDVKEKVASESVKVENNDSTKEDNTNNNDGNKNVDNGKGNSENNHFGNGKFDVDNSKATVDAVLKEFAGKDRSDCKKSARDGMTCYLCTNKDGSKHEECMYASES